MSEERIDKILVSQNIASRSEVQSMIRRGSVTVNGVIVRQPNLKADPSTAVITVAGQRLQYKKYLYIMMNKPSGVLSASKDQKAATVIDLLPEKLRRRELFPAGRLDKDTTGFLLITDDGQLAHKMLAPKSHVYKLYQVECDRKLTQEDVRFFAQGIRCGEQEFLPAEMKLIGEKTALVEICEGKFHQIKRMFHAVGTEVVALKRLRIGQVSLDPALAEGECRELTEEEIYNILSQNHGIERQ